jgi:hypothetical protein
MAGIRVLKDNSFIIPAGALTISPDGEIKLTEVHLHYDVCPTWLEIALDHLAHAGSHHAAAMACTSLPDGASHSDHVECEFRASMQAIMASAIAVDAFYANIKSRTSIPEDMLRAWRKNRTARYAFIAETCGVRSASRPSP